MATIKLPGVMRHPKTQMLWLRKVVPPHLRERVGQREFRLSLRTKDIAVAKSRYHEAAAKIQRRLDYAQQLHDAEREIAAELGEQEAYDQQVEEWLDKLMPEQRDLVHKLSAYPDEPLDDWEQVAYRTLPRWVRQGTVGAR
jgi:hypothetical protein